MHQKLTTTTADAENREIQPRVTNFSGTGLSTLRVSYPLLQEIATTLVGRQSVSVQLPRLLLSSHSMSANITQVASFSPQVTEPTGSSSILNAGTSKQNGTLKYQEEMSHIASTSASNSKPKQTFTNHQPASGSGSKSNSPRNLITPSVPEVREYLFKLLVIGELGTGKTSFIKRYVHQYFSQHYRATVGLRAVL